MMAFFTGAIAVMEVSLFAFLGKLVDWLAVSDPATFLQDEGTNLFLWSFMLLLGLPLAALLHSLFVHQTLLGNYPMAIRWQAHRYLLGQSLSFYQDEFAGRIATKLMQSSLAVREAVMKLLDVLLYVVWQGCQCRLSLCRYFQTELAIFLLFSESSFLLI